MKITVDISDSDLDEICFFSGESKKGPAIRKMVLDALMMKRREKWVQEILAGKGTLDLLGFEAGQDADRKADVDNAKRWQE